MFCAGIAMPELLVGGSLSGPTAGASDLRLASFQPTLILFPLFFLSYMTLNAPLTALRTQRFR